MKEEIRIGLKTKYGNEDYTFEMGDKKLRITTPPIHTHYSEENQRSELCDKVFCPHGFVGIE